MRVCDRGGGAAAGFNRILNLAYEDGNPLGYFPAMNVFAVVRNVIEFLPYEIDFFGGPVCGIVRETSTPFFSSPWTMSETVGNGVSCRGKGMILQKNSSRLRTLMLLVSLTRVFQAS